jgi:N-methylhydantoinase A
MAYKLGFDIGGTFTDIFAIEDDTGDIIQEKVPTTPKDFSEGVIHGIDKVCEEHDIQPAEIVHLSHGTTVATNALIEREGAETGLITTAGFRDALAIGREKRTDIYNYSPSKPPSFVERQHRIGICGRLDEDGNDLEPLDEEDVVAAIERFDESAVESIAVSLLHAYRNDAHERQVLEIVEQESDYPVSLSSEVMPEIKEYERTLMTTINAYVGPLVAEYISELEAGLDGIGIDQELNIMQANGGVVTPENIAGRNLQLINSGPAAGVLGAKRYAGEYDIDDIITLDIGGTSSDTCVVRDGEIETTTEGHIDEIELLFPQVDVRTVGAGGGSIAWLDDADVLKVGPRSSGAQPGPACYGRGGTEPTVTDAALYLGYLNPEYFLGGEMSLDVAAAEDALETLSETLGQDATAIAEGILDIVTTNMTQAIRLVTVEKGYDPRDFSLTCYGGAGPLFATLLADSLDIGTTLIPAAPGVLSASGLLNADERFDFSTSAPIVLEDAEAGDVRTIYDDLETEAARTAGENFISARSIDMRYQGQTFQLNVEVPDGPVDVGTLETIQERFFDRYEAIYGHADRETPTEAVTWRLQAVNEIDGISTRPLEQESTVADAAKDHRDAYVDGEYVEHTVYDRYQLPPGAAFEGPAIIEEMESTSIADPGTEVEVDEIGNLLIHHD